MSREAALKASEWTAPHGYVLIANAIAGWAMIINNKTTVKWSQALRAGLLASTAIAGVLMASDTAQAACNPAAANNVTAVCTGNTVNQDIGALGTSGGSDGYGDFAINNLNVTVASGASVTGTNVGVTFLTGSGRLLESESADGRIIAAFPSKPYRTKKTDHFGSFASAGIGPSCVLSKRDVLMEEYNRMQ